MKEISVPDWFTNGLQFSSKAINSGKNVCTIKSFDTVSNLATVHVDFTDGKTSFEEDGWNLQHTVWGFETKEYNKL